ncbi:MAG: hypothetical protein PHU08_00265 [Dehalococcoidales bacterium]|nr:hypothetical protein [Dehalococcoidales bacterium]
MERTEEDKLTQSPITVSLGGRDYQVRPLVIRESREWRKQLIKAFAQLPQYINATTDEPEGFTKALNAMLVEMPDMVTDLFFSYAKELIREEIEGVATDAELSKAFEEVMAFAFPLAQTLTKVLGKASP